MSLNLSMTRYCFAFAGFLMLHCAVAHTNRLDSLQRLLRTHPNADTTRATILNALSQYHQWIDFNQSLRYADEALNISYATNYTLGAATACYRQAHCYWALGDSDLAIEKALRAVSLAKEERLHVVLGETCRILAICYRDQQEITKALGYVRQAERLASQEKNWDLLARVYNLAGVIDQTRAHYDSALIYYQRSLQLTEQHATTRYHVSQALSNIGELYLMSDTDKGLKYFQMALASAKETHNKSAEAGILADIGRAHTAKADYVKADEYLQRSLKVARALGLKRVVRHVYLALTDLKIKQGKTSEAFHAMQSYYDVRDSLLNGSKTRQIVELETRFEASQQEQKIRLLEQERKMQRLWHIVLVIGSLLLMTAISIIYRLQQLRSRKARELLETQKSLTEKLKETDALKSRFFANLSHEFRTPLTLILAPVEQQLRTARLSPPEKFKLEMIQRNARRLLTLVNQLLDLSKLEAGKMELVIKPGDLSQFLYTLLASFDPLAEQKQITFVKNIPDTLLIGFDGDKIEKILTNILFNAFKFTPAAGQITVSVNVSGESNEIVMSITDTGKGIPQDQQALVFLPFYQLRAESSEDESGTGLGLSLVYDLVQLYKGNIALSSQADKGTCVTVRLPLHSAKVIDENQALNKAENVDYVTADILMLPEEESQKHIKRHDNPDTILIVEDNRDLQNLICSGFNKQYTVLTASNGQDGLDQAIATIPDIIISDVMMPKVNGLEFTSRIRRDERTSHIPIILLTAKADSLSRLEGLKVGAYEYMAKPFSLEELQIRVANLIDQRRLLAAKLRASLSDTNDSLNEPKELSMDEKFTLKVKGVIEENLGNSFFSVEILADTMNLSRAQLFRKLKALLDTTPSELINDMRLQRAAELISAKADNVAQIGYAVGFNERSYFSKRFRKKYGVSPTEYQ